jgi:hypothetical protein
MCEYCGTQALAAIDELTREHDHVVTLISRVRAAPATGDPAGMAAVARQIAVALGPHTAVEERGLFPPLAAEFGEHVATLTAVLAEPAGPRTRRADRPAPRLPVDRTARDQVRGE